VITLTVQELRQVLTILASDTGDKRCGHKAPESTTPTASPPGREPPLAAPRGRYAPRHMQTVRCRTTRCH